ncbi:MAG: hypothetical protein R2713_15840 [Ilumatobacteraceae bacterium]
MWCALTGDDYQFEAMKLPGRHPIIEAAIDSFDIPGFVEVDIADTGHRRRRTRQFGVGDGGARRRAAAVRRDRRPARSR